MTEQHPNYDFQLPPDVQAMIDAGNAVRAAGADPSITDEESADSKGYSQVKPPLTEAERLEQVRSQAVRAAHNMQFATPELPPTVRDEITEIRRERYSK